MSRVVAPRKWGREVGIGDATTDDYVDERFGFWFAGLVDGEGCFYIGERNCSFTIKLRADDADLLRWVRDQLGGELGTLRFTGVDVIGARRPQVALVVAARQQSVWLTRVFDAFPLRSKKARDYAVWREAAIDWSCGAPRSDLVRYKALLDDARAYREPSFS